MKQGHSAVELANQVRSRKVSSLELVSEAIRKIEKQDTKIRAVVDRDFERAVAAAKDADDAVARGRPLGAFHGIPMTVKECISVSGLKTTFGKKEFADNVAKVDATSVARMKAAGAVIVANTNVPTDLADCQTYNDVYGLTINPHNHERTCGGSSGGSAASLAAGYVPLELGSDLAGSIRTPSHFCGVFGHKSSYGIIPQTGHSLMSEPRFESDIAVIGPMANSAVDLSQAFSILTADQSRDSNPWHLRLPATQKSHLRDFKVAMFNNHDLCRVGVEARLAIDALAESLMNLGVTVRYNPTLPLDLMQAHKDFMIMYRSVGLANLPLGVREDMASQLNTVDPDDYSFRAAGIRAAALKHADWLTIAHRREILRAQWQLFFGVFDLVLCPVHSTTAFPHDYRTPRESRMIAVDGKPQGYNDYLFWVGLAGLPGLPSTVMPIANGADNLPIGVQVVGDRFRDTDTLRFAELYEQALQ